MAPSQSPGEPIDYVQRFNVWRCWRFQGASLSNYCKDIKKCWTPKLLKAPPIFAKRLLKAVATKRSVLHMKLELACQVAFCVCKNQCHFSLRIVVTSKHEKVKSFLNNRQSVKRFCSVEIRCRAFRSFGHKNIFAFNTISSWAKYFTNCRKALVSNRLSSLQNRFCLIVFVSKCVTHNNFSN